MKNLVILTGFIGKDPQFKQLDGGKGVARFSLATDDGYYNDKNEWQPNTNWHTVIGWRKVADQINKEIKKGQKVQVIGKLTSRTFDKQDGTKGYAVEVVANKVIRVWHEKGQTEIQETTPLPEGPKDDLPF